MMNASGVQDFCNHIVKLTRECGRMKVNSDRGLFIFENGSEREIHVLKEYYPTLHEMLIKSGLEYNAESREYFLPQNRPLRSRFKRDLPSPDTSLSNGNQVKPPKKRSKSAFGKDEKKPKDKENANPRGRHQERDDKKYEGTPKTSRSKSENRPNKMRYVDFYGCTLIGDDFLLGIARFNLQEDSEIIKGRRQCGLCISGLNISQATRKLKDIKDQEINRALIYLGSFDIIEGKELIEMINDFDALIKVCVEKGINVVACTLAPIPLYHDGNREATLDGFNKYLMNQSKISVIDVNIIFSHDNPKILKDCYEGYLKSVSGSNKKVKLWTQAGRDLFLNFIKVNLGFAMIDSTPAVHDRDYMKILKEVVLKES